MKTNVILSIVLFIIAAVLEITSIILEIIAGNPVHSIIIGVCLLMNVVCLALYVKVNRKAVR